jgi:hypothetical protein
MKGKYLKQCFFVCVATALSFSCGTTGLGVKPGVKQLNMLADVEPFSIGIVSASFEKAFSSDVAQTDVEVIFHPRENEVALKFKRSGLQYWQFWNEEGRQQFIDAVNRYEEDLTNQSLSTNYSKSRAIYGATNGRYEWKTLSISGIYRSSPVIELGYRFMTGSPYFTTHQMKAKEETGLNKKGIPESKPFAIYFNRAQGEDLARLFDQAFLLGLLGDRAQHGIAEFGRDTNVEK